MSEPPYEIYGAAAVGAILVGILEYLAGSQRPAARGWASIIVGLAFLGVGGFMSDGEVPAILGTGVFAGDLLFRDLCLIAGAIFFATGLVRQLSAVRRGDHLRQLTGALARADQDHTATQDLLASIVRSSISGVMILHAIRNESDTIVDFECRLMNKEAEQILGRPAAKLVGDRLLKHVPCLKDQGLFQDAVSVVETKLPLSDERCIKQGDKKSWYQIVASRHGDGVVATFADVSDRKRIEEKLRHAAQHDTLTGTPNRSLFTERLEQCIKRAKRFPDYRFAVLFLDVDRFKIINDSLGHEAGDQLLISISDRLRQNLRSMDTATRMGEGHIPARLGGDEFALLLDGIHDVRDALLVAERLQKALSEPHMVDGHEIISSSSIGIVTSDGDYDRPDEIMRDADTAMYQAKNSGKARHVVFDERMHAEAIERLNLEKELRQAAENQDFDLVYQPIVSLQDSSLAGFEALLRWRHPVRGTVLPEQFVALAEELDLIVPIGHWILRQACEQLARWQEAAPDRPDLTMCINLSRQQLTDAELVPLIRRLIKETGIDPATLMFEVTESAVMENAETGSRRQARDGRLRHRALLAQLPAPRPHERPEDRPELHHQRRPGEGVRCDRAHHRAAGAQPGDEGGGGGDRDPGAARDPSERPVRIRSGLPVQRARGRRFRRPVPDHGPPFRSCGVTRPGRDSRVPCLAVLRQACEHPLTSNTPVASRQAWHPEIECVPLVPHPDSVGVAVVVGVRTLGEPAAGRDRAAGGVHRPAKP
jgi:diguanylate cyclase (GGDEF)-like protein